MTDTDTKASGDKRDESNSTSKPESRILKSEKGMTCMNWFFVIFLIGASSSVCIYTAVAYDELFSKLQEKTLNHEKVMVDIIAKISEIQTSRVTGNEDQLKLTQEIQNAQGNIQNSMKKIFAENTGIGDNIADFNKTLFKIEQAQTNSENSFMTLQASYTKLESKIDGMESKISTFQDVSDVARENVKFLTKEMIRLNNSSAQIDQQMTKSQNELNTLYADYVKRKGDDGINGQLYRINEQLVKADMRVRLLETQSAKSVKQTHDEMIRFSSDLSEMRRSMNDQMRDLTEQVSKDIQSSIQTISSQIESNSPTQNDNHAKELESLFKSVSDLSTRVASLGNAGEIVSNLNKLSSDFNELRGGSKNLQLSCDQLKEELESKIDGMESKISTIQDVSDVAKENVKFLTKEFIRLNNSSAQIDQQLTKSQNEIITLYADYVKRQGDDGINGQLNGINEQLVKADMRVRLLETQSAKSVKHTHDEMTRFSSNLSEMRRSMNDQMLDLTEQVSKDMQSSIQTILSQIESNSSTQNDNHAKELESLLKSVSDLSTRVASLGNVGEIVSNLNKLSSDFAELRKGSKNLQHSFDQLKVRSEKDISLLTEHIKSMETEDSKIKAAILEMQKHE